MMAGTLPQEEHNTPKNILKHASRIPNNSWKVPKRTGARQEDISGLADGPH